MLMFVTIIAAVFLWPADALAWGPGMHLEIALGCIEKAAIAAPVIAKLMKRFPMEFIYGAVSPDIFLSKMRAGYLHHCHNWRMGRLLLDEAKTDRQRASVYGYLVHLAADVVAHNYYVPYKIVRSYPTRLLSHPYWEMRYDLTVANASWNVIPQVVQGDYREFDELLQRVLKKTLFSFGTSKQIFKSILVVNKIKQLRKGLRVYAKQSKWDLTEKRIVHFRTIMERTVEEFLRSPDDAPCLAGDPSGVPREMEAKRLRKRIRRALQRGQIGEQEAERLVRLCDRRLREGMYQPVIWWPDVYDVM